MAVGETYYRYETASGCLIVTLLPELNDKQWADIERVGTEIVERIGLAPSPRLLVDLTSLTYMGSAMVALIVRLYKTVNGRNGRMAVVNQNELVFEVLKLAGLTRLWTVVETREKGLTALGVSARAAAAGTSAAAPESNGLLIAGILGALGAMVGLALQFAPSHPLPVKVAQLIEFGFAVLGLVVGTMLLVNHTGMRRNVGIALLTVCLLVILGGIVAMPDHATPGVQTPAPATTAAPIAAETPVPVAASPAPSLPTAPPTTPAESKTTLTVATVAAPAAQPAAAAATVSTPATGAPAPMKAAGSTQAGSTQATGAANRVDVSGLDIKAMRSDPAGKIPASANPSQAAAPPATTSKSPPK